MFLKPSIGGHVYMVQQCKQVQRTYLVQGELRIAWCDIDSYNYVISSNGQYLLSYKQTIRPKLAQGPGFTY